MNKNREKESGKLISVMSDKDCDKVEIMLPVMHELSRDNTILYLSKKDIYEESIFINIDRHKEIPEGYFYKIIEDEFKSVQINTTTWIEDVLKITGLGYKYVKVANF
ncbi:hypothetical protein PIU50_003336 [Clostridioides difficile]|nr:hypothetical protein [Clostridioides difficile]MBZ0658214.1 hypothetical protein [Clostridioides difficile]HBF9359961.1 hypothetical protein [Clostridioides difficile]